MSDLSAVLGYLADVAEGEKPPSFAVDDVVFVGLGGSLPGRGLPTELERLAAIDLLHREENLVWRGSLWIVGDIDGVRYQWPIERQQVSLSSRAPAFLGPLPLRARELGSWTIPAGLVYPPELTQLALEETWGGRAAFGFDPTGGLPPAYIEARTAVRRSTFRFVARYLASAGLPELPVLRLTKHRNESLPAVIAEEGFFVERHPLELDHASVLRLWASQELERSVLAQFYGSRSPDEPVTKATNAAIQTPLPLNAAQRQAIRQSQTLPITAVSGPPGTGKSHLVAAAAINQVAQNKSVLVATQSLHASDVIAELIDRYPMVEALRFGDDGSVRRLSDKLATGIAAPDDRYDLATLERRSEQLSSHIEEHRDLLARRIGEIAAFESAQIRRQNVPLWLAQRDLDAIDVVAVREAAANQDAPGLSGRRKRRSAAKTLEHAFGSRPSLDAETIEELLGVVEAEQLVSGIAGQDLGLDDLWVELDRLEEQWRTMIGDLLEAQRRDRADKRTREAVSQLASALRLEPLERREALTQVGPEFLEVIPLWIGTLAEIEALLPVEPALFDLVILDEASQISQVSAVPALARAQRALVVGDTRQLRHVSSASAEVQVRAAAEHALSDALRARLDDRVNSVFDVATAVAPVVELDEHFRSVPHLIGFSDREFYAETLRLMTQHPASESRDAIEVITLAGERDDQGVVRAEVDEVLTLVRRLMSDGQGSIGVVSPFEPQAQALELAFVDTFRLEEIEQHQLRVGTVHSFQGTERDHIIVSLGAGSQDSDVALRLIEDPAIFNVMVTRARSHVTLVTSLTNQHAGDGLLSKYLRYADEPPSPRREQVHGSGWTERVAADLARQTTQRVITDYEVAGETIDVVVGSGPGAFGIETEVHPAGPLRHIERHQALRRAGWDLVSLYRSSCFGREETAIAALLARISSSA